MVDEDVPGDVARFLARRDHEVLHVREHFVHEPKLEDWMIARGASDESATVVTWNSNHFRALATRQRTDGGGLRNPGMSLIAFECPEPLGLTRIEAVIDVIEHVHATRVATGGRRMIARVQTDCLRFDDL